MAESTVRDRERSSSSSLFLPPIRTARYAGDGLDYRRPVMTSVTPFIDLTGDDQQSTHAPEESSRARRLPRFGREVIDVEEDGHAAEEELAPIPNRHVHLYAPRFPTRPHSAGLRRPAPVRQPTPPDMDDDDDFEIVAERTYERPLSPDVLIQRRSPTPYVSDTNRQPIDLTNDDDVIFTNTRRREDGLNAVRPGTTAGVGTRSEAGPRGFAVGHIANIFRGEGVNLGGRLMQRLNANLGAMDDDDVEEQMMDYLGHGHNHHHHHVHHHRALAGVAHYGGIPVMPVHRAGMPPMTMDFDGVGFDMGLVGGNRPPSPKYSPPAEAPHGFTRNPAEDEVVVCPNCGDELAMGDDEVKQQVWAVKGCGHVSEICEPLMSAIVRLEACLVNVGANHFT